jgi:hypothetical protein
MRAKRRGVNGVGYAILSVNIAGQSCAVREGNLFSGMRSEGASGRFPFVTVPRDSACSLLELRKERMEMPGSSQGMTPEGDRIEAAMSVAVWAYDFTCRLSIAAMRDAFNAAGPWSWQLRDSDIYGFYLNCRPLPHVRLRVHRQEEIFWGRYARRRRRPRRSRCDRPPLARGRGRDGGDGDRALRLRARDAAKAGRVRLFGEHVPALDRAARRGGRGAGDLVHDAVRPLALDHAAGRMPFDDAHRAA